MVTARAADDSYAPRSDPHDGEGGCAHRGRRTGFDRLGVAGATKRRAMTDPNCRVCDGEGWVCEEHGSHAAHLCPSTLVLAAPCICNPSEDPPLEFEIVDVDPLREDKTGFR